MSDIPKFCALCDDCDEVIAFCGRGDTSDEAFDEFISGGDFEDYCEYWGVPIDHDVSVYIYSCTSVDAWPEEERRPEWKWVLDKKLETRTVKAK